MMHARKLALTLTTTLALCAVSATAHAGAPIRQGGNFGLGVGSGTSAYGLSLKYYMSGRQAIQATAGIGWGGYLGVGGDYLFEMPEFFSSSVVNLGWNLGPGVGVGLGNDGLYTGASFVGGFEFNFNPVPIDLVLEWRPTLDILPGLDVDLIDFSGHLRFYF